MSQIKALYLDKASVYPDDLDFSSLNQVASWQWFDNANIGDIHSSLEQAEVIVTNKVKINSEALNICKNLKLICVAATGVNNVDIDMATSMGVNVCNVKAYATASVAQHVFSLILSLNRHIFSYHKSAVNGDWSHSEFFCSFGPPIRDLAKKVMGIIGYGELGQAVAKIAKSFGMKVLIAKRDKNDHREGRVALPGLLSVADVVSLHCPLTDENYHMIDSNELALMKLDAILINTARGGLINEQALRIMLEEKKIYAGLDVLEEEPPTMNNVLTNYQADNLLLTPHVAWASRESRQRLINEIAKNILAYQQGEPRNII